MTTKTEAQEPKLAHTPGVWRFVKGEGNGELSDDKLGGIFVQLGEFSDDGYWIAEVCGDVPEAQANAKLLTAAADLLEALQLLLNDPVVSGMKARIRDSAREEKRVNPIAIAEAAIRKATRAEGT